jgi:hypothetical protein
MFGQPRYDFFNRRPGTPIPPQIPVVGATAATTVADDLDFLIRFLANPMIRLNPNAQPFQPVLVRPSQHVLEENTQLIDGIVDMCAICQDSITANESCRLLVPCRHRFHRVCIDQWFQRSVFCPTCRHDIRDSGHEQSPAE